MYEMVVWVYEMLRCRVQNNKVLCDNRKNNLIFERETAKSAKPQILKQVVL